MEPETKTKRPRGSGSIFRNGSESTWWISFSERGFTHRENARTNDHKAAEKLLALRLAQLKCDTFVPRTNVKIDELIADLFDEYQEKQRKSLGHIKIRWHKHLEPFFTRRRACDVSTEMIRTYTKQRREAGASPATCNRELAVLKRSFNLALESTPPKIRVVPYIPMFQERNVRLGFLSDPEYDRLANESAKEGLWLRALLATAYNYGWRRGELLHLRIEQVDLLTKTIRLNMGQTKNNAGRLIRMTDEVFTLLSALIAGRKGDDYVFVHENGTPVRDFRKSWRTVCERAGKPDLLFHDLRRSGARNLRRLGIAESVAMKVTGHKTPSIFKRYDIVDETDLIEVANRLDEKRRFEAEQKSNVPTENSNAPALMQSSYRVHEKQGKTADSMSGDLSTTVLPN